MKEKIEYNTSENIKFILYFFLWFMEKLKEI